MAVNLKGRSFLSLADFTPEELRYLLDLGHDLKAKRRAGVCAPTMQGKHIVLLFEKTSTRTRCSFEVAATQEGAHVTYLDAGSSQMGKKESLEDSAKVLGRFFDGIEYRGYEQSVVEDLAKWSGVPVWNGLTDADHPTQILADLMTIEEHCKKPLNKIKVVFPGDVRNNMCYAWMMGAAKLGMPAKPLFQFCSVCGRHRFGCSGDSRILLCGGRLRLGLLFQVALVLCQDGKDHLLQCRLIWNRNRYLRCLLAVDIVQDSADKKLRFAAALPVEQVDHRFMLWVTDVEADREFPGVLLVGHSTHRPLC